MPTYPIHPCACGCPDREVFERAANSDKLTCRACGGPVHQDYSAKGVPAIGNRAFTGQRRMSFTEGFHPKEVGKARRAFGDRYGGCIQDSGEVHFTDRAEERGYKEKAAEIKRQSTGA